MTKLRVKEICKAKGITIKQLAEQIGVADISLSRSINTNPMLSTLEKIANALDVEIIELFKVNNSDFTALIKCYDKLHNFDNIGDLQTFIANIDSSISETSSTTKLRVKEICKEKGITQKDLAEQMGVAEVSLSRNINTNPTLSTLENIATALDVEVVELLSPNSVGFVALIDCNGALHRFDHVNALKSFILNDEVGNDSRS